MADLISLEMYTVRLGRTLNTAQSSQASAFIADASALVRRIAGGELDSVDDTTVPPEIIPVVVGMVRRGIENPRGNTSERIGDYQWAGGGGLYATDEEAAIVQGAVGLNVIREVTLTNDMPDRLLLDTDVVPGLAGFELTDL